MADSTRAAQHVRVLPAGRGGMRPALASAAGAGPTGVVRDDGVAVVPFPVRLPKPLLEPLAVERLSLDNYFSIAKAQRDLGHQPLFTTKQAMADCLPYYVDLRPDEGRDHFGTRRQRDHRGAGRRLTSFSLD